MMIKSGKLDVSIVFEASIQELSPSLLMPSLPTQSLLTERPVPPIVVWVANRTRRSDQPPELPMSGYAVLLSLLVALPPDKSDDPPAEVARARAIIDEALAPNPIARRNAPRQQVRDFANAEAAQARPARGQIRIRIDLPEGRKFLLMEPKQPAPQVDEEDDAQPVQRVRVLFVNNMAVSSQNFDEWVFSRNIFGLVKRPHLKAMLTEKAEAARVNHHLDEAQYHKLLTAGSGDIQRFFDRVEERRVQFEAVRQDFNAGLDLLKSLEPLAAEFRDGPFGAESLFTKTLNRMVPLTSR